VATLLCITAGSAEAGAIDERCIKYTYRGSILADDGPINNYTGLYIHWSFTGGAFMLGDAPLYITSALTPTPLNFTPNIWNSLQISTDSEGLHVTVNGQTATWPGGFGGDTNGEISLGAYGLTVHYDNVVLSVGRKN
jgi:hypothetical protein